MSTQKVRKAGQEDLNVGTGVTTRPNPLGGTLPLTQIGIHTFARGQAATTDSWTPGEVAVGSYATTTVNVSGAIKGDHVSVSFSDDIGLLQLFGAVNTDGVVTVILYNLSGAPVTVAAGTVSVLCFPTR